MNQYIGHTKSGLVTAPELADWALSHGIGALTTEEIAHLIGTPSNQVKQRMAPLRKKGLVFSPARSLWVPVPAEYRTWGAPDPMLYIDDMMAHLGVDYCVGWLTAAALHGASHHAAQVFQVAVDRQVRDRAFGRSRLEFFERGYVGSVSLAAPTHGVSRSKVSSPGTTMLMLAADVGQCGGIHNVANLVLELAEESPGFERELASDAPLFSDAASRRIGWLLDEFGEGAPAQLTEYCATLKSEASFLSPLAQRTGSRNRRWNIVVNEEVEPDV